MKVLIPTEKVSFSKVMEAVRSNTVDQGGDGRVTLVLERVDETGNSSETNYNTTAEDVAQGAVDGQAERTSVFDPRIFNSTFE